MELQFKKDFDQVRSRWDAFWKGQGRRPIIVIVLPKAAAAPLPTWKDSLGDFELLADKVEQWAASHEFLADAVPSYHFEFGPDHFSLLLGSDLQIVPGSTDTTWCVPFLKDYGTDIRFRPEGPWWEKTVAFIRAFRARFDGRLMLSGPTLIAGLDCLVAIRGVNEVMMDLAVEPQAVTSALRAIDRAYTQARQALATEMDWAKWGSMNRHGMYSPGAIHVAQCDASCMIGPDMFQEFGLPSIRHEIQGMEAVEYHLDGPGALQHLPVLCQLPQIKVIQWVPGAGEAAARDWSSLYRQILDSGKGQIFGGPADEVVQLAKRFPSNRNYLRPRVSSIAEAQRVIQSVS